MKILCTMPGKHGDSLWALPTARALALANTQPVDFLMSPAYSRILPLYERQLYIHRAKSWPSWHVQDTAPMTPWSPFEETLHHEAFVERIVAWDDYEPVKYDEIIHLGYRDWPDRSLPHCIYEQTKRLYPHVPIAPLDLSSPWITAQPLRLPAHLIIGFTDEHFELKYGITCLLDGEVDGQICYAKGSRWETEGRRGCATDWMELARLLAGAKVFLGCCSAMHVLAVAMGVKVVAVEPNDQRWNSVFWPMPESAVHLVRGNDGKPTFDARHIRQALQDALRVQVL